MCASRCGVLATVEDGRLPKVTADPEHPNGCICVKGAAAPEIVYAPDRLQYPMVRTRPKGDPDPGWARLSWDEALDLTASRLLEIKARHGPEAVVFPLATPIGTASQDFLFRAWRLANAFGSPNAVANTHICQWHRDTGREIHLWCQHAPAGLRARPLHAALGLQPPGDLAGGGHADQPRPRPRRQAHRH
jgi:anaerobic selenocysteine-containing dehydrogenase